MFFILLLFILGGFIMLQLLIRYTTIIFCSDYIYHKLLNNKNADKHSFLLLSLITILITITSFLLPPYSQYLILPLLILLLFVYLILTTNTEPEILFTTLLLSYGICYCFFCISMCISAFVIGFMMWKFSLSQHINSTLLQVSASCIQILLCPLPFRLKQLKNGLPLVHKTMISSLGVFISSAILFFSMVISTQNSKSPNSVNRFYLLFIPFAFIFCIFIFIWGKKQLQQIYLSKLREREFTRLEQQLLDYQEQLSTLKTENEVLSKLIHRDNKLIPSMQLAVHEFIETMEKNKDITLLQQKGTALLTQLENEMAKRNNIVTNLSQSGKQLTSTNVPAIDQLLNYMLHRGMTDEIDFDFSLSGSIRYMTEEVITESDCLTLLADLLENAMIATKTNHEKHVFLHIGITKNVYTIDVWDNGIPFTKEVLYYLGKKRYTTHKKEGGSGIGMMSTYELIQKYNASLIIDETGTKTHLYTKKVSIVFDKKQQYCLSTNRNAVEIHYLSQRKDLIILPLQNI